MYAECGSIEDARIVFNKMTAHNTMLAGYAIHGHAKETLEHFGQKCQEAVGLDMVTFVSLLSAYSHVGLVDGGLHYFESMGLVCGTSATVEHYACMVDLLGCAGYLQKAEDLIETCLVSQTLLCGWPCSVLAEFMVTQRWEKVFAKQVLESEARNSSGYVLLSNIYAAASKQHSSAKIKQLRLERHVKKQPGRTWIEVNKQVYSFTVGDQEHPQINGIHAELE